MASSNFVGWMTDRSTGLAPLRIRATYTLARRPTCALRDPSAAGLRWVRKRNRGRINCRAAQLAKSVHDNEMVRIKGHLPDD